MTKPERGTRERSSLSHWSGLGGGGSFARIPHARTRSLTKSDTCPHDCCCSNWIPCVPGQCVCVRARASSIVRLCVGPTSTHLPDYIARYTHTIGGRIFSGPHNARTHTPTNQKLCVCDCLEQRGYVNGRPRPRRSSRELNGQHAANNQQQHHCQPLCPTKE